MFFARTTRALCGLTVSATLLMATPSQAAESSTGPIAVRGQPQALALHFAKRRPAKSKAKSKGPLLTPQAAEEKRAAIREAARPDLTTERWGGAAETLESNAAILGDPVTMLEAGEARLKLAERERSIEQAERAIETTRVALDILHFYRSVGAGQAESDWLVIDPDDTNRHLAKAGEQIAAAQALIEAIEAEQEPDDIASSAGSDRKKKRDRTVRPGTGMIAAGSVFSAVGVAGITMVIAGVAVGASKQNEVEDLVPGMDDEEIARLDDAGGRANRIALVGTGLAIVGIAVGVPLIVFGVKKRRASTPTTAFMRVAPAVGPRLQGLTLSGRF